ncbi:glucosamine-6-phosphate deaminase [Microbacterium lacus]|uniref:glucosamine-6-phosphate deaminase n=1 Tax=Microbacterium lacus TaxID=415217 RepID=UPI00384DD25E
MAEVVILENEHSAGDLAASYILAAIAEHPDVVLGLATGSSPASTYAALTRRVRAEGTDVSGVRGFALDEYVGLPAEHPESYREVIRREVIQPIGLDPARIHVPNGDIATIAEASGAFEQAIAEAGGVEIQLLGIGASGHIGFNEPGSSLASVTRVKTLTEKTRNDNARFFDRLDDVPTHCITQGIGTILRARRLILLAFGEGKAHALAAAVEGPVSASIPASAIQLHPHVTVIVDEAAASHLQHHAYYRHAWQNQPDWAVRLG